jgi:5-carboxymethyl-2-hydroxymuconate isomerase
MPHLRLYVPEEWLREDFQRATGFDARKLLDRLVQVVAGLRMENPAKENPTAGDLVPMINLSNLKHAIVPLYYAHVGGDSSKRFLHATLAAGNDTPGRTAAVRRRAAEALGQAIDQFVGDLPELNSVTVHVQDIDRDRGYSTTAEREKARKQQA